MLPLLDVGLYVSFLTIGYSDDFTKDIDISSNLILTIIANAFGFAIFMNYYIKKQKMDNALSRLDRLNLVGEMAASRT